MISVKIIFERVKLTKANDEDGSKVMTICQFLFRFLDILQEKSGNGRWFNPVIDL